MIARCVKVAKKDGTAVGGSVRIAPATGAAPVRTNAASRASSPTAASPQATILERNEDHLIIEITCGCGQKSFIRCNYATCET